MGTIRAIIKAALRKCGGIIAEGEEPSADLMQDSKEALGTMLDSWSLEELVVYGKLEQVKTWPANSALETLGPTGSLVGLRPISLYPSTYFTTTGGELSYPISLITREEYNSIGSKSITSNIPELLHLSPDMPDATLRIYPVPTVEVEMHFMSMLALDMPGVDLSDEFDFPPGYERALIYNLAIEISPELGIQPSATVQRLAVVSKRNIKRINSAKDILGFPSSLVNHTFYNINLG